MTRETAKKFRKEINAFADGEAIECKGPEPNAKWEEANEPCWVPGVEYRIKPKPRTFWINIYNDDGPNACHPSETVAKYKAGSGAETIQVIEVL